MRFLFSNSNYLPAGKNKKNRELSLGFLSKDEYTYDCDANDLECNHRN